MATEVAALVARLEADTRKFDKGMKSAEKRLKRFDKEGATTRKGLGKTDKSMGNLSRSVKGFALAVGGAFATKAVVNFAKDAIGAASDLGESINAVEVVFGDAAEGIKSLGEDAAEAVGLSNQEFNTLAVGFAAFVEKIDAGGDDVVGVMKELTGRAADFASVMNIDVAEAATIFRSGLAGETEPLRKFGIDLAAVTVTQRALALGLADTSSALTEQDKIIARYNLLMEQTQKTQGDFANTSDSLANATRILTSKWENAKAVIGEALIPTLEDLFPLLEEGIDIVLDLAIDFGILTGAVSDVEGAIRKSKFGLDKEATALDFVFAATEQLRKELKPGLFDTFGTLGGVVLPTAAGAMGKLLDETDNLAETFGLTAKDADFLRENAEELADEMQFGTAEAVLELADRLDIDLVKAMNNIAAKEGIKLLENTQDIRDAVLDGTDAVLNLVDADEDLAEGFKDIQTEAKKAADRIQGLHNKMRALTDPAFALISAAKNYKSALDKQNEALDTYGEKSTEAFDAGIDVLTNFQDLIFAADEYAQVTNTDVATALLTMGANAGVPLAVIRDIIDALAEADNFAGEAEFTVRYIEENKAALDRFLSINIGAGAPGATVTFPPISQFHTGGVVPGVGGTDVAAILQAGETVRTVQQEQALRKTGGGGLHSGGVVPGVGTSLRLRTALESIPTELDSSARVMRQLIEVLSILQGALSNLSMILNNLQGAISTLQGALSNLTGVINRLEKSTSLRLKQQTALSTTTPTTPPVKPKIVQGIPFDLERFLKINDPFLFQQPFPFLFQQPFPFGGGPFHSGGVIPGLPGANVPIIAQAGETVRTQSQERALGGTTIIVEGFVGSELQLAAQIDKLLTRRSKTSKLGF